VKLLRTHSLLLTVTLIILAQYFLITIIQKPIYCGIFTFIGQTGFDLVIFICTLKLSFQSEGVKKQIFCLISLSFFCAFFADGIYNLILNILGITQLPIGIASLFEIPFLLFLLFQLAAWIKLFTTLNKKSSHRSLLLYLPFMASAILMLSIFVFFINWKIEYFSIPGLFQLSDTLIESLSFALVAICLVTAINKEIVYIATGFLIVVSSDYLIRLAVVEQSILSNNIFDTTWIIGLAIIFHGVFNFKTSDLKPDSEDWCYTINCIQSQVSLWNFSLCLFSVVSFIILSRIFTGPFSHTKNTITHLPPILIVLSMMTILISAFFSKKLLTPLKSLEDAINSFLKNEQTNMPYLEKNDYGISEYVELKKFLKSSFSILNEKIIAEKQLSNLSARVAHDIRSPLGVMEITLTSILKYIPKFQHEILQDAIQSVRDIANNLLVCYRNPFIGSDIDENIMTVSKLTYDNGNVPRYILLSSILEQVVSQKYQEWQKNPCELTLSSEPNAKFTWIKVTPNDVKRMISNLLNNAYESLDEERKIMLTLSVMNKNLQLEINDTGCGIPSNRIDDVLTGISLKHEGNGLGLSSAKNYIEKIGGKLALFSQLHRGTKITLTFPFTPKPLWFPESIVLPQNNPVIVLDDDASIHNLWKHRLQSYETNSQHFMSSENLIKWWSENPDTRDNTIFLMDHELHNDKCNGLEIIEKIRLRKLAYLITSHAEETTIQQRCEQLGAWLVPKSFIGEIVLKKISTRQL
jgi:signal transduction histidine kinase